MMKLKIITTINSLLAPFEVEITRSKPATGIFSQQVHDPLSSYMKSDELKRMLVDELSTLSRTFFSEHLGDLTGEDFYFSSEVESFLSLYSSRHLKDNTGGSGFHNAFWIFLFARVLKPNLIVESGVWKGHTSWLLEQACPDATVLGFDINLRNLEYKSGKVRFYEQDWSEYQFEDVNPEKSLIFFDCHVNHAKRILESRDRGFKHILFDDNPPVHKLYGYGLPGFPTAQMLDTGLGIFETEISWCWQGKDKKYQINMDEAVEAKELVKIHEVFPDVGGPTRYGGFSFLSYVRL